MRILRGVILGVMLLAATNFARGQDSFSVTGTAIPKDLLKLNYGPLPRGIRAFDLSICNLAGSRQALVSSEVLQALAKTNPGLEPIGRQIMLAAILRNQNHSVSSIVSIALNSATGVLSVLAATRNTVPPALLGAAALGSFAAQQLLANLRPVLTADQVEKFESQVLEPALVLDGGSCVERTVFALSDDPRAPTKSLTFHVR
jgi:hypothetical protein